MSIDSIGDLTPRVQYVATASQTAFDYPFPIFESADLQVDVNGEVQVLTTDYAVSGVTDDGGGTVTFVTGLTVGDIVTLWRDTSVQRTVDYQQNGPLTSRAINDDFDRLTVISQELKSAIERTIRFPVTAVGSDTSELSPIANWTSKYLFIDSNNELTPATAVATTTLTQDVIAGLFYPVSDAESGSGFVLPIRKQYNYGDVRRYCTAVETNHQAAFDAAHAANEVIYAPAGTWNVNHFLMDIDGRRLRTDGFTTIIKQRTGNINRRVIEVCASNIIIDDIKIEGNIATDTGEQQHGILINGNHPVTADRNIQNIHIGNVWAENIRGDALYIGAPVGSYTRAVTFGVVRGTNIYRNVVSIVGGTHVWGAGIYTDGGCGYETFDIEPDGAGVSTDIYIGFIRGGNIQCAPPVSVASRIHIGTCDLDPAFQPNSTPGYSEGGSNYAEQIRSAVNLRNTTSFRIDHLKIRDHGYFGLDYIFNPGEQRGQNISIGYLDSSGVGGSESTINALLNLGQVESFTLDDGNVILQSPTTDTVLIGSPATSDNKFIVNRLTLDGRLVRYCSKSRFCNIFANHTNNISLLLNVDDSVLECSDITQPSFMSLSTGITVISSKVTCSGTYIGSSCSNIQFIGCSGGLASVLAGSATYDPPSLADGAGVTTAITVTGAALGGMVTGYSASLDLQNIGLTAYVYAAGSVKFRFQNESTFVVDLSSLTLRADVKLP